MLTRQGVAAAACGLLLSGCAPNAYIRPGFFEHPPKRVAVLPFTITYAYDLTEGEEIPASHRVGRDTLRKTFYYGFTPYGYQDVEPEAIDQALAAQWGPLEESGWRQATPQELGAVLGADALIYGDITRLMHVASPLYTETSLSVSMRMVDAASGEELWRSRPVTVADRGGALMKKGQVVDFVKDQARAYNPQVKFLRVSDAAVSRALKGFPNPPLSLDGLALRHGSAIRLAILPLAANTKTRLKGAETLRGYLAASMQETPFDVLEIQQVDAALEALGWHEGEPLPEPLKLDELAQALGADAVIKGKVTRWGRTYLVVQSWVKAEMEIELLDAASGATIWSKSRQNSRQAGILKGPTGIKSLVTSPVTGLKSSNLDRIAKHLTRDLASDLTESPAVQAYVNERRAP